MFGMGFFEILMVAVVAIIFLGPEKLPKALVDVAKFFRTIKRTMDDAKDALDKEVNLSKIKEEALAYKESFTQGAQNLTKELNLKSLDLDENILDTPKKQESALSAQKEIPQTQAVQEIKQDENKDSNIQNSVTLQAKQGVALNFGENCEKGKTNA